MEDYINILYEMKFEEEKYLRHIENEYKVIVNMLKVSTLRYDEYEDTFKKNDKEVMGRRKTKHIYEYLHIIIGEIKEVEESIKDIEELIKEEEENGK